MRYLCYQCKYESTLLKWDSSTNNMWYWDEGREGEERIDRAEEEQREQGWHRRGKTRKSCRNSSAMRNLDL